MKILVTGGAGFVGSHLVEKLLKEHEVSLYDNLMRGSTSLRNLQEITKHQHKEGLDIIVRDILDFQRLKEASKEASVIYHLAALPSHRTCLCRPYEYINADVMGTVNVLEVARQLEPTPTVVFSSSNTVYGKQEPPFREEMVCKPEGPYALSKLTAERFCEMYSKYYGLNTVVLRFHNVVGTRCHEKLVLHIFVDSIFNGERPIVCGRYTGGRFVPATRDFTNVSDVVEGAILASKTKGFEVFNLGTGIPTSVLDLLQMIAKQLNVGVTPILKELLPHESTSAFADISKAKEKLGYNPKTTVEESVKQFIEWYRNTIHGGRSTQN